MIALLSEIVLLTFAQFLIENNFAEFKHQDENSETDASKLVCILKSLDLTHLL